MYLKQTVTHTQLWHLRAACSWCLQRSVTHGWNVKSCIRSWKLFLVSSPPPPPPFSFLSSLHLLHLLPLRITLLSPHLVVSPSCVFTFLASDCSVAVFLSPSIFQGHGIFPWVFAHKIISCWRAGPAVELIASNADNGDKGKGRGSAITFGFSQINSLD